MPHHFSRTTSETTPETVTAQPPISAPSSTPLPSPPPPLSSLNLPILSLCLVIATLCSLDRVVMSVLIVPMSSSLSYADSTKGLIASAFSIGYALSLLPAGILLSKFGYRNVLLWGIAVWSVAQALTPTAAMVSLPALLTARVLMGVGESAAIPSLQLVSSTFVPQSYRSRYWSLITASLSLGTIFAYSVTPPFMGEVGWEGTFQAFGLLGVGISAAWIKVTEDVEKEEDVQFVENVEYIDEVKFVKEVKEEVTEEPPYKQIFTAPEFWALVLAHSCSNFFLYFTLTWLPTFYMYTYNLTPSESTLGSTVPFILAGLTSIAGGYVSDYLTENNLLSLTSIRKLVQTTAFLVPSLTLLYLSTATPSEPIPYSTSALLLTAAVAFQSLSSSGFGVATQDISKKYSGLIYGASSVVAVAAGAAGQYGTGVMLDSNGGDFGDIFRLTSVVEAIGAAGFLALWNSERRF